jgi:WD40 repeat protein
VLSQSKIINFYKIHKENDNNKKERLDEITQVEKIETNPEDYLLCTLSLHSNNVNCIRFSPDGKSLAACSDDKSISISIFQNDTWMLKKQIFNHHENDILGFFIFFK